MVDSITAETPDNNARIGRPKLNGFWRVHGADRARNEFQLRKDRLILSISASGGGFGHCKPGLDRTARFCDKPGRFHSQFQVETQP
jgi:hypothetical protein